MSVSNSDLIADSLRDIGVIAETETPSPEQGATALRQLNQMIEEWEESEIRLEYFAQTSLSETCPIPAYAEGGITAMLAVRLAPVYGATVSAELAKKADDGMTLITRKAMHEKLKPVRADRPLGEGHPLRTNILNDT